MRALVVHAPAQAGPRMEEDGELGSGAGVGDGLERIVDLELEDEARVEGDEERARLACNRAHRARQRAACTQRHTPAMFPALPLLPLLVFAAHAALAGAAELSFELRHAHAVSVSGQVVFADVPRTGQRSYPDERPQRVLSTESEPAHAPLHIVPTRRTTIFRAPQNAIAWPRRRRPGPDAGAFAHPQSFPEDAAAAPGWWTADEVDGPDVSRRSALLELAKMTNNAYLNPNETGWYELGAGWTVVRARRYMYTGARPLTRVSGSRTHSAGSRTLTASAGTSLRRPITRPSCSLSRAPPGRG
jgi:hypothetical protein